MNELETIQFKRAKLDFLLQSFQVFVALKKDAALVDRIELEIKKLVETEVSPIAIVNTTVDLRQG